MTARTITATSSYTCNACESHRTKPYILIDGFQLMKCNNCSVIFLVNYDFTPQNFLESAKPSSQSQVEFWSIPELYKKHQSVFNFFFQQRFYRLSQLKIQMADTFDIGIGYGFWANFVQNQGINIEGIDISQEAINYTQKTYNINSTLINFEDFSSVKKFDTVFMFDVLEHIADPVSALKKVHTLLKPKGVVYIQVPNVIGLKYPYKHGLGLPYHIWQFNYKSLKKLLEKCDFEILDWWTGNQGIISHYENGKPSFSTRLLWKLSNFLKIGNRIQIIAQRN